MGRFKKEVKKAGEKKIESQIEQGVAEPIVEGPKVAEAQEEQKSTFVDDFAAAKVAADALDSEKAGKDILLKNIKELEDHARLCREELARLGNEIETKYKTLNYVDNEIKSKNFSLSRQGETFDKLNQDKIRTLDEKMKELDKAAIEYTSIIRDGMEKTQKLKNDLASIETERQAHKAEIIRITRHLTDIEGEISRKESDIAVRETALAESLEAFEKEKAELKPELSRIQEIKNENKMLWDQLDSEKQALSRQKDVFEGYKTQLEGEVAVQKKVLQSEKDGLRNQEAKFRKWEQDLKDIELELKAREVQLQKEIKRLQLKDMAASG